MTWDDYFISMLPVIASKSKDPHTKVGCIIVGPDHEIRSTGYNSFPRGIDDNNPLRYERPLKYQFIEHAERNAIYNAARIGVSLKDCCSYQSWYPCTDCARAIISCGIKEIVIDYNDDNPWKQNRQWDENMKISFQMLEEAKIIITKFVKA